MLNGTPQPRRWRGWKTAKKPGLFGLLFANLLCPVLEHGDWTPWRGAFFLIAILLASALGPRKRWKKPER